MTGSEVHTSTMIPKIINKTVRIRRRPVYEHMYRYIDLKLRLLQENLLRPD